MPEDLTETVPEVTEGETVEPEGPSEAEKALAEREAKVAEWEAKLQRQSSDLGRIAKELETARATTPASVPDDGPDFDPQELATLERAMKKLGIDPKEVSTFVAMTKQNVSAEIDDVADSFFSEHKDVEPNDIIAEITDMGYDVRTLAPVQLKKVMNKAYKNVKVAKFDPEAEAQRLYEAKLAELKADGSDIKEIKKGTGNLPGAHRDYADVANDESLTFFDKMDSLSTVELD